MNLSHITNNCKLRLAIFAQHGCIGMELLALDVSYFNVPNRQARARAIITVQPPCTVG